MAAKQIVKRIENCLDEEVRKIQMIYDDFSNGLFDTDNQFEAIGDHQKLSDQIKEQSCSIFDLLDQLVYTIENWSSNHNHLRDCINHRKLGNQCVTLKRLLSKYRQILVHLSYRGEFGIKNVNLRTKLTKAIEQLNLNSVLISEQPYVKSLNMYTVEQESIFRIKTDEIKFTLINYSDLELDIMSVRLVEENYLNSTFRADDLLLSGALIGAQNPEFNLSTHSSETNKIVWVARNHGSNKKTFKVRVIYLMNNQSKNTCSKPIKYRFLIVSRFRNQIESHFYTDKFGLIQDTDGQENDSLVDLRPKFRNHRPTHDYLEPISTSRLNALDYSEFDELDLNRLELNRYDDLNRLDDYIRTTGQYDPSSGRASYVFSNNRSNQFDEFRNNKTAPDEEFDRSDEMNSISGGKNKENEDMNIKLDQCIKKISNKFNQRNAKSFKFNEIERAVLKERLIHSGFNFHLPVDQLLNRELDYFCFSFNTYFKYASFCYCNLVDDRLREQIYGFLSRDKIIQLLSNSDEHSYLIVFSPSVLSTLVLNYLDDKHQLIELLFFEHNLRCDELNNYLKSNKQHLKFPILKN